MENNNDLLHLLLTKHVQIDYIYLFNTVTQYNYACRISLTETEFNFIKEYIYDNILQTRRK